MEKNKKLNMKPEELVALASSLAISLSKCYDHHDLDSLKCFFSTVASNISLIQNHCKSCGIKK